MEKKYTCVHMDRLPRPMQRIKGRFSQRARLSSQSCAPKLPGERRHPDRKDTHMCTHGPAAETYAKNQRPILAAGASQQPIMCAYTAGRKATSRQKRHTYVYTWTGQREQRPFTSSSQVFGGRTLEATACVTTGPRPPV
jgi:hypothetical protein